jgi:hypothetical protein
MHPQRDGQPVGKGGLAAGESARIISAHYLPKSCRIVGIMWDVR